MGKILTVSLFAVSSIGWSYVERTYGGEAELQQRDDEEKSLGHSGSTWTVAR